MGRYIFLSTGEPSGDLHGSNLIRALRTLEPDVEVAALGGPKIEAAGGRIVYPLAQHPIMGVVRAIRSAPLLRRILNHLRAEFSRRPPDAIVLIDNPGFNWLVARLGRELGIPVIYHVPPQIWAWASHRVEKMKRLVDLVLCALPFEEAWYHTRGMMRTCSVGHPYFDALAQIGSAPSHHDGGAEPTVLLLPGSRLTEAKDNGAQMIRAAAKIRERLPNVRFVVAAYSLAIANVLRREADRRGVDVRIEIGRAHELIPTADAAISVSGSVSLELLYHQVPTAILYSVNWFWHRVFIPRMLHTPHVTLVNLLAGRRVYPEFVGCGDYSGGIAHTIVNWLEDPAESRRVRQTLANLKRMYAVPGASAQAARAILDSAQGTRGARSTSHAA